MTVITINKVPSNEAPIFRQGDLVFLKDGKEHATHYKSRPVIVTQDMERGDTNFNGFCLIDNDSGTTFNAASFEFNANGSVTISN